ncbi:hypothetical protein D3C78_1386720 [compost metagenome]
MQSGVPRLAQQAAQGGGEGVSGVRRGAVVQGEAAALVFGENAGVRAGEGMQVPAQGGVDDRFGLLAQHGVGACAPVGPVAAARGQQQGREEAVEIVDRASADQGQGAAEPLMQDFQGRRQLARYLYRIGGVGYVQQGAVDIEEQRAGLAVLAQPILQQGACGCIAAQGRGRVDLPLSDRTAHGPVSTLQVSPLHSSGGSDREERP